LNQGSSKNRLTKVTVWDLRRKPAGREVECKQRAPGVSLFLEYGRQRGLKWL